MCVEEEMSLDLIISPVGDEFISFQPLICLCI